MSLIIQIAQLNFLVGGIEQNARRVIEAARAARSQAQVILFPELALTGYPPEDLLLRDDFIQRVEQALEQVLAQAQGIHLVLGYPRREGGRLYNVAGVLRDGQILAEY
ncbi:MAG: nitrilase-related carbon-nitrogen hydrolase, partial [Pseudomonadota bacterium]